MSSNYDTLPGDLPKPVDDGAADHLPGTPMPALALPGTDGDPHQLAEPDGGVSVLYVYPRSGVPGEALPAGWDAIPGARGCTPESCGFRDHHADLRAAGAAAVFGISSQDTAYQAELAGRLALPYPLLSDENCRLADLLGLPTFDVDGMRLYKRLTLIVADQQIVHAFYPVFPPDTHAAQVLSWLQRWNAAGGAAR